ncbi:hypothetical protein [Pseudomonas bohemica]|uniref:hypothetical protein n=1 Tax=Pseudomonas bohemica TaxID=2044872 RepID=UPI000DA607BA|nr:hypothetical protein [Pseudomonas bohemica]
MVTPDQAEVIANKAVEDYINACKPQSIEDAGQVLLKLLSMTGLALCAARGQPGAVAAIESVAAHISQEKYARARLEPVRQH